MVVEVHLFDFYREEGFCWLNKSCSRATQWTIGDGLE